MTLPSRDVTSIMLIIRCLHCVVLLYRTGRELPHPRGAHVCAVSLSRRCELLDGISGERNTSISANL